MKTSLVLFILAVSLFIISNNGAVASHDGQPPAAAVESADDREVRSDTEPMAYPHCSVYAGNPCPTPGWTRRCQWTQFEQARCVCRTSLVWECA